MTNEIKQRIEQINKGEVHEGYTHKYHIKPDLWMDEPLDAFFYKVKEKNSEKKYNTVFTNSATNGVIPQSQYFEKDIANEENIDGYYIVRAGDYIYNPRISEKAPYGPINQNLTGCTGIASPLYTVFSKKENVCICDDYIRYYLDSAEWNKYIYSVANYGARFDRMNISDSDFMNMPIALPPFAEQQKIAEILMQCDKVIELKQKRIEEEKKLLKYLMKIMLSPNFDAKSDESPLGWRKCHLEDVCDIATGDKDVQNKEEDGKYPFFIRSEKVERIDTFSYDGEAILIPGDGKIGEVFHYINGKFDFHQRVYKISDFNKDCSGKFVYYYLKLNFKKRAMTMTAKATVDSLRRDMLTRMEVSLPDIEHQKKIVEVLDTQNSIIEKHEQELKRWQEKKKSLMQLLLTGVIRAK